MLWIFMLLSDLIFDILSWFYHFSDLFKSVSSLTYQILPLWKVHTEQYDQVNSFFGERWKKRKQILTAKLIKMN